MQTDTQRIIERVQARLKPIALAAETPNPFAIRWEYRPSCLGNDSYVLELCPDFRTVTGGVHHGDTGDPRLWREVYQGDGRRWSLRWGRLWASFDDVPSTEEAKRLAIQQIRLWIIELIASIGGMR